jgi:hypothetical protein
MDVFGVLLTASHQRGQQQWLHNALAVTPLLRLSDVTRLFLLGG